MSLSWSASYDRSSCDRHRLGDLTDRFRTEEEKLWHAVVDHVTVYNDDRLVYALKDGTEITVML